MDPRAHAPLWHLSAEHFFQKLKAMQNDIGYGSARLHELLKAFPLRKKAERIAVGNVTHFITNANLIAVLKPFGRLDNSCWADARREAFITLNDGVRLSQIPARLEIKTKGVITPVYVGYGFVSICYVAATTPHGLSAPAGLISQDAGVGTKD
ncbi:hypothetical protein LAZ67_1001741 [Cordylochernes scorpioides]|uniref:Uncharacterized protein n=1 Tax=Cordylochernes scorpioides TaxID=51811 RepID=A0ABY6JX98_9ARAC|nr:hypothetical protein LAZ67_1001741 [Cordylochernes scorpioides]